MKYYSEIHFIDQHWSLMLDILSEPSQQENMVESLRLLTGLKHKLYNFEEGSDTCISGLSVLTSIRRHLLSCIDQDERHRCVNVMIISMYDSDKKKMLNDAWYIVQENYYPPPTEQIQVWLNIIIKNNIRHATST